MSNIQAEFQMAEVNIDFDAQIGEFWHKLKAEINNIKPDPQTLKAQELPLARIKKIMKLDDDVRNMMISAEAPVLLAKAAEIFVRELTLRSWLHTERCRRRTLQRVDISSAIYDGNTDQFDFLIDIVPREDVKPCNLPRRNHPYDNSGSMDGGNGLTLSQANHLLSSSANPDSGTVILNHTGVGTGQGQTIHLGTAQGGSNAGSGTTQQIVINAPNTALDPNQGGGQPQTIQYVLQLPNAHVFGNQPIQLQIIPPSAYSLTSDSAGNPTVVSGNSQVSGNSSSGQPQLIQIVPQVVNLQGAPQNQSGGGTQIVLPQGATDTATLQQVLGAAGQQVIYLSQDGSVPQQQFLIASSSSQAVEQTTMIVAKSEPTTANELIGAPGV